MANGDATLIPQAFLPPERSRPYPTNPGRVHLRLMSPFVDFHNQFLTYVHIPRCSSQSETATY
ncbi:hypothetical protein TorRG33x02_148970 [Trema orientale]|uniref:Uncharacterized protein n=1 Tax=Trema orientale TaxID=63057 RepID=A0A2P5EUY1_TREOI|nr:hypothetical protein TorRG33x02_148970 [Trema orientale]